MGRAKDFVKKIPLAQDDPKKTRMWLLHSKGRDVFVNIGGEQTDKQPALCQLPVRRDLAHVKKHKN